MTSNEKIKLYHGSPNTNLTHLDIGIKDETGDQYGRGIYLTTDIQEAKQYAGPDGKVYNIKLDDIKLFNLSDKLPYSIKDTLLNNTDILSQDTINSMARYNRKDYIVTDIKQGQQFYKDKIKEWQDKDNKYFGNRPTVHKQQDNIIVTYTDYDSVNNTLDNMTGENLHDIFSVDKDPSLFVDIITSSGYNGIITHNNTWFIIYTNIDKVHIADDVNENKSKIEEVSRNELLTKAKMQTKSRYQRSTNYKGFYVVDVDTDHLLTTCSLVITCRVGDYWDTVELENVLYWIQLEAEKQNNQINNHVVRDAILQAIDAMDIKVDCTCADMQYRFAYFLSEIGAKYGKQEHRPAKITNPNNYGCLCKHLISMLSNKKWLQQVASPVMDWVEKRIVEVNRYLRTKEDDVLTLPNELARRNAKMGHYSKMFKDIQDKEDTESKEGDNTDEQNG